MENEPVVEIIRFTDVVPVFHIISLSVLTLLVLILFILGIKKSGLKFQWLLSSLAIWIGIFGGITYTFFWVRVWGLSHSVGYPKHETWTLYQMGTYFRLGLYLSLALISWTLSIVLRLLNERNRQPEP
jgi:hypothetical protein